MMDVVRLVYFNLSYTINCRGLQVATSQPLTGSARQTTAVYYMHTQKEKQKACLGIGPASQLEEEKRSTGAICFF
jgi:hypothetical protein